MNLAIVGSRGFDSEWIVAKSIRRWMEREQGNVVVVSGGARGADQIGIALARQNGLRTIVHLPEWARLGKRAGFVRNELIVRDADVVLAFFAPGPRSAGTQHTVDLATKAGKTVHIYHEGRWWTPLAIPARSEEERTDGRGVLDPLPLQCTCSYRTPGVCGFCKSREVAS